MSWTYNGTEALASAATRFFERRDRACRVSPFVWMTDPQRVPDVLESAKKLPEFATLIYRHFGADNKDTVANELRRITADRNIQFLIGQDEVLAIECGADGLHLPERHLGRAKTLRQRYPDWIMTSATHSKQALQRTADANLEAAILSPVFSSTSASAVMPLGIEKLSRWVSDASLPVIALGGINVATINQLEQTGIAGIAGVTGFVT